MKKILSILAMAAMIFTVACNKDNKPHHHGGDDEGDDYEAPIVIDGDLSDWAQLDAAKVASCSLKNADGWAYPDIKSAQVYADPFFIYVCMLFNDLEPDATLTYNATIFLNGDNDTATGGYNFWGNAWDQGDKPCLDVMVSASFFAENAWITDTINEWEVCTWGGEDNADDWGWEEAATPGFVTAKAIVNKGIEIAIRRDLYPAGKIADQFTVGFMLQGGSDPIGILPNEEVSETNEKGLAPLLVVNTNK